MRVKLRIDLYGVFVWLLLIAGILLERDSYIIASALFACAERLFLLDREGK